MQALPKATRAARHSRSRSHCPWRVRSPCRCSTQRPTAPQQRRATTRRAGDHHVRTWSEVKVGRRQRRERPGDRAGRDVHRHALQRDQRDHCQRNGDRNDQERRHCRPDHGRHIQGSPRRQLHLLRCELGHTVSGFRSNYIREDCNGNLYVYGTVSWGPTHRPIAADATFAFGGTSSGTVGGNPATFTDAVTGRFDGTNATGTYTASPNSTTRARTTGARAAPSRGRRSLQP